MIILELCGEELDKSLVLGVKKMWSIRKHLIWNIISLWTLRS